jgi:hypothetical protein
MLARFVALFQPPCSLRRLAATALLKLTPRAWEETFRILQLPTTLRPALNGSNLEKFARALASADEQERYAQLTTFGSGHVALDPGVSDMPNTPPPSSLPLACSRAGRFPASGSRTRPHAFACNAICSFQQPSAPPIGAALNDLARNHTIPAPAQQETQGTTG